MENFEIGNWVKIHREPTKEEFENWDGIWANTIEKSIGQYFKVLELDEKLGAKLQFEFGKFWVPFCALERWSW